MKFKNFIIAGIVGGIANFLLGWLFYGILFKDFFPQVDESTMRYDLLFMGCLIFSLFIAFIFTKWAAITQAATGAKAGAVIGFFYSLSVNLFMLSNPKHGTTYEMMIIDVAISIVMTAITGVVIAIVNGKLK
jgi:hypothetical protein